jgi:hypothetical protein
MLGRSRLYRRPCLWHRRLDRRSSTYCKRIDDLVLHASEWESLTRWREWARLKHARIFFDIGVGVGSAIELPTCGTVGSGIIFVCGIGLGCCGADYDVRGHNALV